MITPRILIIDKVDKLFLDLITKQGYYFDYKPNMYKSDVLEILSNYVPLEMVNF